MKLNNVFNNKKNAFTLIELLIVIAIIGILFIVLVSKVDFATDKAKATGVQTDFRSFQLAFDTVAKENAGFNTFGFNTGDNAGAIPDGYAFETTALKDATIGDGIRNSYDQGDKNLNGKQDAGEVFTGRKIYTETWTEVYTLVKPGTTGLDIDAVFALESAINANLDPKLHITINAADGKIAMANQARDPWKNEYHGVYISQAERDNGADRGAIIIYSNGANGKWGSAHDITNGVVSVTVPGNNTYGKDDMSFVSCYTYGNGFGEVQNLTTGFSNNKSFFAGKTNSQNVSVASGLVFEDGTILTWEDLKDPANGLKYGYNPTNIRNDIVPERTFVNCTGITNVRIPNGVTSIGNEAFSDCYDLTNVIIPNTATTIESYAFFACDSLTDIVIPDSVKVINYEAFAHCTSLRTFKLPKQLTSISSGLFSHCSNLESITIGKNVTNIDAYAFSYCTNLNAIYFDGNIAEWNAIIKDSSWNDGTGNYTIYCTDGSIPK